jgi:streptogramin lyase
LGSVWVGSLTDQTITVVNPQTAAVEHTVSFKTYPSAMAVGAGALWVIEDSTHPDEPAVISRVAPAGDTITRIAIPRGSAAGALGGHIQNTCGITGTGLQRAKITVGGGRVWFVCVDGTLGSVDPRSNRLNLGTYAIRGTPTGIAADANSVWITDLEHNAVLRVDPATRAILNTLPVAAGPRGIVAGAGSVWVAEFGADVVSRIGAQAPGLPLNERSIPVGRAPSTIVYGDGSIWVANEDGTISRIDPASNIVAATISIGSVPVDIAVGEGGVWITTRS